MKKATTKKEKRKKNDKWRRKKKIKREGWVTNMVTIFDIIVAECFPKSCTKRIN